MQRLTYFLSLMGNTKVHNGNKCNKCGSTSMFQSDFHFLATEFLDICHSKYCSTNKGITEKTRYLKMIDLFHEYVIQNDTGLVSFQMSNEREFNLCLKFLFEIGHKHDAREGNFIITTDITRPEYYEYLYQSQN